MFSGLTLHRRRPAEASPRLEVLEADGRLVRIAARTASIDVRSAAGWGRAVAAHAGGGRRVAVDMTSVRVVDSAGLGAIVAAVKAAREVGGDVALYALSSDVRSLVELVRLHQFVDVFNDAAEVLRSGYGREAA